jgi:hypothetical protein
VIETAGNSILSYGGGINSTALAILLVNSGWRGDIVFADTGCEWPDTYCFMDYFEAEWLKPRGLKITQLKGMPWQTKRDGIPLINYCESASVIPLAGIRWCTQEWKVDPLHRWANERDYMIGISAEESHRQQGKLRPLVDMGVDRNKCISIIETEGLPVPRKSGCYICPFQRNGQWRELWQRYPKLYERALQLEENAQRKKKEGRYRITLDPSGRHTLREYRKAFESEQTLPGIDMDELRDYQPCVCGL